MKLSGNKKGKKENQKMEESTVEDLVSALSLRKNGLMENADVIETYPLMPPFSFAVILEEKDTKKPVYIVDEIPLTKTEREKYFEIKRILETDLEAPREKETPLNSFRRQFPFIRKKHPKTMRNLETVETKLITYYLERDIAGLGIIDPLFYDPYAEDISCSGVAKPIYLWHRKYENIRTNVIFNDEDELDNFIVRLAHKAGKHVSIAFPMIDATLPGKHRLAIYYRTEVTPLGTSFTIRKFREDPLTIIDLIQNETLNLEVAAYLWMIVENKFSSMIIGSTGAGKTTSLNAMAGLIHPQQKIISVEEVAEINLPRENWVSTIARSGFGTEDAGQISLFELIKSAVRHRPDWIIVGEVRGEEAYVLFQALATGHGGICTMHAEDPETAVKRLTQPPMNIPSTIIPLMHCAISIRHVKAPVLVDYAKATVKRRFTRVSEIESSTEIKDIFLWDNSRSSYRVNVSNSHLLKKIGEGQGVDLAHILDEYERRKEILSRLVDSNARSYSKVADFLQEFYGDPKAAYNRLVGLEVKNP
ncbi:type II/IV secretion system ATPase subunit [Candidatus Bathyarchaeota archaeon]|nr:type II/IV secretion system ATPase subunit [Candidatus Bathyarchaeota archaeon]